LLQVCCCVHCSFFTAAFELLLLLLLYCRCAAAFTAAFLLLLLNCCFCCCFTELRGAVGHGGARGESRHQEKRKIRCCSKKRTEQGACGRAGGRRGVARGGEGGGRGGGVTVLHVTDGLCDEFVRATDISARLSCGPARVWVVSVSVRAMYSFSSNIKASCMSALRPYAVLTPQCTRP
jgi:hypothetical protein